MVRTWLNGHDVVMAVRQRCRGRSLFKRASSRAFYWVFQTLTGAPLPSGAADFYLLDRHARRRLRRFIHHERFVRGAVACVAEKPGYVAYNSPARAGGRSSYTLARMVRLAWDALAVFGVWRVRRIATDQRARLQPFFTNLAAKLGAKRFSQ